MRRARSQVLVLAVLVGLPLLGACNRDAVHVGEARLEPHGAVQVAKPGQAFKTVKHALTVKTNDRVRVRSGTAIVRLTTGEVELRAGSSMRVATSPELLSGDLLAVPKKPFAVQSAGSVARIRGAARFQYTSTLTVASYAGGADMTSAGSRLLVPALRQAAIPALGQLPQTPSPLQYKADDPWDRRFLADAIDLGVELQARSDGASNQFRGQGLTAGFYRTLFPDLEHQDQFTQSLLSADRPPGEHIVGVGIALAGDNGDFASRWNSVFAFRGQGAAWGLVAMDQGVTKVSGLLKSIDEALGRAPVNGQGGTLALAVSGPAPGPSTTTTARKPKPTSSTTSPPTPPPTTQTTTTLIPPPTIPPGLLPGSASDQANQVVTGLFGLLPRH